MGHYEPRTAADETADARAALADAQRALRDLRSHLRQTMTNPEGALGNAHAADRNAEILAAALVAADQALSEQARGQLTVVS
jgi:hypothetical protein